MIFKFSYPICSYAVSYNKNLTFFDQVNVFLRVLYIKFEETEERGENDLADCPGGNKVSHHCPWVTFSFKDLKDVDLTTSGTGICDA